VLSPHALPPQCGDVAADDRGVHAQLVGDRPLHAAPRAPLAQQAPHLVLALLLGDTPVLVPFPSRGRSPADLIGGSDLDIGSGIAVVRPGAPT